MAGKHAWPSDEALVAGCMKHGSKAAYASALGVPVSSLKQEIQRRGLKISQPRVEPQASDEFTIVGDTCTIVTSLSADQRATIDDLLRERDLDPADWEVVRLVVNTWDAMTSDKATGDNRVVPMRQFKVSLQRKITLELVVPAVHVPPVKRPAGGRPKGEPEYIVVEGDHQAPYHDPRLHAASLAFLSWLQPQEHVTLGDVGDYPSISRYADHPAAMASVNDVIQADYSLTRDKREASPLSRSRRLKGNHDYRLEGELLNRAERMYGIRPADTGNGEQIAALSLRRLLHLDDLGVELVEDPRGWEHAEIELVPGRAGLVVRHGWLTGANTARRSLEKRGRSLIVGHTHTREHFFKWDPSAELERQAAVVGCMCLVRNERFPHFAPCDSWLQGMVVVSRWPDHRFMIEHVRWEDGMLMWRNERYS